MQLWCCSPKRCSSAAGCSELVLFKSCDLEAGCQLVFQTVVVEWNGGAISIAAVVLHPDKVQQRSWLQPAYC